MLQNVQSITTHNNSKWKMIQITVNKKMDKLIVKYSSVMLSVNEINQKNENMRNESYKQIMTKTDN